MRLEGRDIYGEIIESGGQGREIFSAHIKYRRSIVRHIESRNFHGAHI